MNGVKPTIEDVAQLAGVSRATVSRVINDLPGVCEPMRNRVRQAVTQLGYRPNEIAQALASGRRPRSCKHVKGAKPTIEDVARLAGVSRATVSRVINDLPGVCEPMRNRVRQAVTQLGYQPNEIAQALASGRQRTIGLIAADYPDLHYSRVLTRAMTAEGGAPSCASASHIFDMPPHETLNRLSLCGANIDACGASQRRANV